MNVGVINTDKGINDVHKVNTERWMPSGAHSSSTIPAVHGADQWCVPATTFHIPFVHQLKNSNEMMLPCWLRPGLCGCDNQPKATVRPLKTQSCKYFPLTQKAKTKLTVTGGQKLICNRRIFHSTEYLRLNLHAEAALGGGGGGGGGCNLTKNYTASLQQNKDMNRRLTNKTQSPLL